jgi:hypothetical protein
VGRERTPLWAQACEAIGVPGRIVHDLRRSGVKHLIDAGRRPAHGEGVLVVSYQIRTLPAFSGHWTSSMLRRYHIIDVHDLRHAATRASSYGGRPSSVVALRTAEHRQNAGSGPAIPAAVELGAR